MPKYEQWLTEDGLTLLAAWARDGLTDEQIAEKCGIVPSTLYEWKNKYSEISESLKKGKEIVDIEVENALLKRALGYTHKIIKPFQYQGEVVVAEFIEEVAPDVTAQIYWLKNRKPDKWRDKPEVNENEKDMQTAREILVAVRRVAIDEYRDRIIPETD